MWFIYILECSDYTLYTGITNNIDKRINLHNSKKGAKYTMSRLPVILKWTQKCNTKSEALKGEYKIKQLSKIDKLNLIKCKASI